MKSKLLLSFPFGRYGSCAFILFCLLIGFESPLGSSLFLINCFEVGLLHFHSEYGPGACRTSYIIYSHLTTKGSNEAFMMFQKLKCNRVLALGSKCQIALTSVHRLSILQDQKVTDSNRAVHWWPVAYFDIINMHSLESLKYIEIQLCYSKSYCQDLKLQQQTSGSQLSYSV